MLAECLPLSRQAQLGQLRARLNIAANHLRPTKTIEKQPTDPSQHPNNNGTCKKNTTNTTNTTKRRKPKTQRKPPQPLHPLHPLLPSALSTAPPWARSPVDATNAPAGHPSGAHGPGSHGKNLKSFSEMGEGKNRFTFFLVITVVLCYSLFFISVILSFIVIVMSFYYHFLVDDCYYFHYSFCYCCCCC